ncbi:MAG: chorismate synthase [Saprospiraceae bacterium]
MNSFGRIFRLNVYGESHGPSIGIIIDGVPPGIHLEVGSFSEDILRRKPGQIATTSRVETDYPIIKSGVFNHFTTGSPLCIEFENNNLVSSDYAELKNIPRPGHADFVANKKYLGFNDYRGGGHFSGRLSLLLVAAGVVAKKILSNIDFATSIISIGGEIDTEKGIHKAIEEQDSVGGIIECKVKGLSVGIGEPFFDSIESVLSHLIFSIPAVKGIEFGSGFKSAEMFGSKHNDPMINTSGETLTNHSGGIAGGLSNGNELILRIVVKPTSSTPKEQISINLENNKLESFQVKGRHDLCIALRVPVVLEAAVAIGLCDLMYISKCNSI